MSLDLLNEVRVSAGTASGGFLLDDGDQTFSVIDRLGFNGFAIILSLISGASGTGSFYLEHSDDNVTWSAVPVANLRNRAATASASTPGLLGTIANLNGKMVVVQVTSKKRYMRVKLSGTSTPSGPGALAALRYEPNRSPVAVTAW